MIALQRSRIELTTVNLNVSRHRKAAMRCRPLYLVNFQIFSGDEDGIGACILHGRSVLLGTTADAHPIRLYYWSHEQNAENLGG